MIIISTNYKHYYTCKYLRIILNKLKYAYVILIDQISLIQNTQLLYWYVKKYSIN